MYRKSKTLALLIAGVLMAGCGASAASASKTTATSSTTTAKSLTNITMVEAVSAPAYAPVTLAKYAGFFKKMDFQ